MPEVILLVGTSSETNCLVREALENGLALQTDSHEQREGPAVFAHFQPIVAVREDGQPETVVAYEALVRGSYADNAGDIQQLGAMEILKAVEQNPELRPQMTRLMLRQAVKLICMHQSQDVTVHVNVTLAEFIDSQQNVHALLLEEVRSAAQSSGMPEEQIYSRLGLEIVEECRCPHTSCMQEHFLADCMQKAVGNIAMSERLGTMVMADDLLESQPGLESICRGGVKIDRKVTNNRQGIQEVIRGVIAARLDYLDQRTGHRVMSQLEEYEKALTIVVEGADNLTVLHEIQAYINRLVSGEDENQQHLTGKIREMGLKIILRSQAFIHGMPVSMEETLHNIQGAA